MKVNKTNLKKVLSEKKPDSLAADVIETALDSDCDDLKAWFEYLLQYGCQSGTISHLTYYSDTAEYYDKHYDEIEEMREEYEKETGESLKIKGDLKNWFAWFAFEETARKIFEQDFNQEF